MGRGSGVSARRSAAELSEEFAVSPLPGRMTSDVLTELTSDNDVLGASRDDDALSPVQSSDRGAGAPSSPPFTSRSVSPTLDRTTFELSKDSLLGSNEENVASPSSGEDASPGRYSDGRSEDKSPDIRMVTYEDDDGRGGGPSEEEEGENIDRSLMDSTGAGNEVGRCRTL